MSNTESELGLGLVVSVAHRRVELEFPAAGENRVYAIDNAPLSRVQYEVDDQVRTEDGEPVTIESVMEANQCFIYSARTRSGETVVVPEQNLNSAAQFSKPQDRLFSGQIDRLSLFQLRQETLDFLQQHEQSPVLGLLGARIQWLPHQLYIADKVSRRFAPRVLLADEVGLGKTIEAGLILHRQLISGRASRVLIVVPDSLVHQWLVEMLRRFNLRFSIIDEQSFAAGTETDSGDPADDLPDDDGHEPAAENPFEQVQLALCALSTLSGDAGRLACAVDTPWDLLIVDEAHHLQWSESEPSLEYRCIEALSEVSAGLILLTATPEQLGEAGHFARLRLLDPDRYHDLDAFLAEQDRHQPVNELVQRLLSAEVKDHLQNQADQSMLRELLGEDRVRRLLEQAEDSSVEFGPIVDAVIRDLLDRYGTGRVLFRNTRATVKGFPGRKLEVHRLTAPEGYSADAATVEPESRLAPETVLGDDWLQRDPRVQWLIGRLTGERASRTLVICARADTAVALEEHLRRKGGLRTAVFHEGMNLVARDRAAAWFADDEQNAQALVCSEIGSEGRNFQFAHHLVLFDLPLVPDLLEQRIGRLDRIGQRETVRIHVPVYRGSAQEVLLRFYHEGLGAFEQICPPAQRLMETFRPRLFRCMQNPQDVDALETLLQEAEKQANDLRLSLQQGRDRLLELNSFNRERADRIVDQLIEQERRQDLASYMERVFDLFGVEQDHHTHHSLVVRPGDHMLVHSFPALPADGATLTFQRDLALLREDMQYLTWEHPMVTGAMDLVVNNEYGNTAFCTIKLAPLKAGTLLLEAMFRLSSFGPARLQLARYLPSNSVRILIDQRGTDLGQILSQPMLDKLARKARLHDARSVIRHTRSHLSSMIRQAETLAAEKKQAVLGEAVETMRELIEPERERLAALARVNPNIRAEEISAIDTLSGELESHLLDSEFVLDSIRVVMVSE